MRYSNLCVCLRACVCVTRHVSFRGPKGELPKGDDGSYGTSLTWAKAMDPASDVIIAYKQVCLCVCVCVYAYVCHEPSLAYTCLSPAHTRHCAYCRH